MLESYFIHDCLAAASGRPLKLHFWQDPAERPFLDTMVVVILGSDDSGYLAECRRRGCGNVTLLHLGDEKGTFDTGFYADAHRVIRNYFFPHVIGSMRSGGGEPVVWLPKATGPASARGSHPASCRHVTAASSAFSPA